VFVFAVTEVTGLLHHDLSARGVGRFVLVFWLVWWAWTQFTWALNVADTTHHGIQMATLSAVVLAFAMATGVGRAFDGSGLWFAVPYVALRLLGLGVYLWDSAGDPVRKRAVVGFSAFSSLGLVTALAGGAVDPPLRTALWAMTIALDVLAASVGARAGGWDLRPAHFAERHALFVILALGESLIAAGGPAAEAPRTAALVATAVLAVVVACLMWWVYFAHVKPAVEEAMEARRDEARSTMARDAYSLLHFPVLCGIVGVAVAVEEAVAHPDRVLSGSVAAAFACGIGAYLLGMAAVQRRAVGRWLWHRVPIVGCAAALVALVRPVSASAVLAVGAAALAATALLEERRFDEPRAAVETA
jgi:low temperature requirement protein LtrA